MKQTIPIEFVAYILNYGGFQNTNKSANATDGTKGDKFAFNQRNLVREWY